MFQVCSAVQSWLILPTLAMPTSPDSPRLAVISFLPPILVCTEVVSV